MKTHVPDPGAMAKALAGRLDTVEARDRGHQQALREVRADIAALGRGIADLTIQVRDLTTTRTTTPTSRTPTSTNGATDDATDGDASGSQDDPEGEGGQPDWLSVTDPGVATGLLVTAERLALDVLAPLGAAPVSACWPLHPSVVVELLALAAEHDAAYSGEKTTPVSEWLARWLPGAITRITAELKACANDRGHRVAGKTYAYPDRLDGVAVATWWADTHGVDPDAVEAFTLQPAR